MTRTRATPLADAGVEGTTRADVEHDVATGRATAEEIVTENALADDAAAFDELGDDDGDGESELEAEVEEAAEPAEAEAPVPAVAATAAGADAEAAEPEA
jgi:hypothetical protein